jgi:protein-S-isoprenylcysteine O-methyltransferase Ste14
MIYILIGAAGFIILFFFDLAALKQIRFLKTVIWVVGNGLIFVSLNIMMFRSPRYTLPDAIRYSGIALSVITSPLLAYSLLIEIPFKRTYLDKGTGDKLVTTGTYALVRHPGVLWLILLLIGFFLSTGSKTLLITLPVWAFLDILYIIIQDKIFFVRQFGEEYVRYQQEVPMLIPNIKSIKRCLSTFFNKNPI